MNNNWIIVGSSGYPKGFAEINKIHQIARGLVENGAKVTVLSRKGVHKITDNIPVVGSYEKVYFKYCSGRSNYDSRFFSRNIRKFYGLLLEIYFLIRECKSNIIINSRSNFDILFYFFIAKIARSTTFITIVEDKYTHSFMRNQILKYIDSYFYWNISLSLIDIYLPISHFLKEKIKFNRITFILPPLFEYSNQLPKINPEEKYFIFCGSVEYDNTIKLIIDSFKLLNDSDIYLYLVLHGNENKINKYKRYSNINVKVLTKLTQDELLEKYSGAIGLLIPLNENDNDNARFPQKIAEYCSVGKPIITTKVGEIKRYFVDKDSALIAEDIDPSAIMKQMKLLIDNPILVKEIGIRGYEVGYNSFNRELVIRNFLEAIRK